LAEPLLKWPGGKRKLLRFILTLAPARFNTYYEPCLGGGALFFALRPERAHLSDRNLDLITTYKCVRDNPRELIRRLSRLKNTESAYYAVRSATPGSESEVAARLIYLAALSFNGIHRVNLKGVFNVPYGYKRHLRPCAPRKIHEASEALKRASLSCQDFEAALAGAGKDDLVYLDPPYTTAHADNGFVKYNAKIFTWNDQKRLADVAHTLAGQGCSVIVSNADHESIRRLYRGFHALEIDRYSVIAASSKARRRITECVYYNRIN
jgi:DNA adenine methylase